MIEQLLDGPWQEYDCPIQQADVDLFDESMVYQGQTFHCHWCGGSHTAGVDVNINTYAANEDSVELPKTLEELNELKESNA